VETPCRYHVVRYVPNLETGQSIDIGLVLIELAEAPNQRFVGGRFTTDWQRVKQFDADVDVEMLKATGAEIVRLLAQPYPNLESMLTHLEQSLSNAIQLSESRFCTVESPREALDSLFELLLGGGFSQGAGPFLAP
jgi:hypothetical protein